MLRVNHGSNHGYNGGKRIRGGIYRECFNRDNLNIWTV